MPQVDVTEQLLTVRDWIRWAATQFEKSGLYYGHGTDNAWDEAAQIVLWSTRTPWHKLESIADARLVSAERAELLALIRRRIDERVPVGYITGESWFAGLRFIVNEHVLIPRSPIAELIASGFEPWLVEPPARVLDLCTGSGCIGIATAVAFPETLVDLSDISGQALAVAEQNIALHHLADRVRAIESDGLSAITGRYDLIVTNPPYVDAEDMASLPQEYRAEPELALASGADGLDFTRSLLRDAASHLSDDGVLIAEVGNSWVALEEAFPAVPFTWLEFEHGGHGVFVLTREQLVAHQNEFK